MAISNGHGFIITNREACSLLAVKELTKANQAVLNVIMDLSLLRAENFYQPTNDMVLSVSGRNSVHSLIGSRKHRKLAILDKKNNEGLQSLVIKGAV